MRELEELLKALSDRWPVCRWEQRVGGRAGGLHLLAGDGGRALGRGDPQLRGTDRARCRVLLELVVQRAGELDGGVRVRGGLRGGLRALVGGGPGVLRGIVGGEIGVDERETPRRSRPAQSGLAPEVSRARTP